MRVPAFTTALLSAGHAIGADAFVLPSIGNIWGGTLKPVAVEKGERSIERNTPWLDMLIRASEVDQQPITFPVPQHLLQPSTGFVAFGDSYSAGIGTGVNGSSDSCLRGLGAHAQLIHRDFVELVGEDQTSFQH